MKKASDIGITDSMTIEQAKEIMRRHLGEGFCCPACNAPTKSYRRTITSAMAVGLIMMVKASNAHKDPDGYIHTEDYFKSMLDLPASIRADVPKLRFWDLIESKKGIKTDGNPCNGYYRVTRLGEEFVSNSVRVPKYVKLYNNKRLNDDYNGSISVVEALQNKFDYQKLMA